MSEIYRALYEEIDYPILITGKNKIIDANKACLELFGAYEKSALINSPALDEIINKMCSEQQAAFPVEVNVNGLDILINSCSLLSDRDGGIYSLALISKNKITALPKPAIQDDSGLNTVSASLFQQEAISSKQLLKYKSELFEQLFMKSIYPVVIIDKDEKTLDVNPEFEKMFGYKKEELLDEDAADFIVPETQRNQAGMFIKKSLKNETMVAVTQRKDKYGHVIDVEVVGRPIEIKGQIAGMFAMYRDRRVETKALADLRRERAYFKQLFDHSPDPIAIVDDRDRVVHINGPFEKMFGYSPAEAKGSFINDLIASEKYYDETKEYSNALVNDGKVIKAETVRTTKYGEDIEVELIAFPIILDKDQLGAYAFYRDISERKNREREINKLVYRDPLTGAYNRLYVYENLSKKLKDAGANGNSVAFFYFDLDDFKIINDQKGHSAGDELLKSISKRIRNHFGDRITLCRVGGDEFLGLINSPSEKPLELYIDELRKLFATPFIVKGEHYMSGLSIGHATYPADGTNLDTLIHTADLRMYREKRINRIKRYPIRKSLSVEDVLKETEEFS